MNIQDIGFFGITGCIILACILAGFFKGLMRALIGIFCLSLAGYTVLRVHRHANLFTGQWAGSHQDWLSWLLAILAGILTLMLCRYLLNFLVDPFNATKTGQRIGFGPPAALLVFLPACAFLWLGLAGLRYGGCLVELQDTRQRLGTSHGQASTHSEVVERATPLLLKATHALEQSSVGEWHRPYDPFHHPEKTRLCQILVLYNHTRTRDIMLGKAEFNTLVNLSSFLELAYEEQIKATSKSVYPGKLLTMSAVSDTLKDPDLIVALQACDPQQILTLAAE